MIIRFLLIFSILVASNNVLASDAESQLPEPTGTYSVGYKFLEMTDSSREDPYNQGYFRKIKITIYYPSADVKKTESYGSEELLFWKRELTGPLEDKEITQITKEAMEGKIDFKKALIERVSMLQGVSFEILEGLQENIKINDGAKELIKTMKHNGAITVLVSGGFTFLTDYLKKILDFDFTHANSLQYFLNNQNKKILNGRVNEPILDNQAELNYLNDYLNKNNLSPEDSICVGDGANDIDMIIKSGMGVAFNGKKALNQIADLHFKHTNLLGLLYAQGYSDKEINST